MRNDQGRNKTIKLLRWRLFVTIVVTLLIVTILPLGIISFASKVFSKDQSDIMPASERLCADPRDIDVQGCLNDYRSAAVVDEDLNVTELGGKRIFDKDKLTMAEWTYFLSDASKNRSFDYDIAYYDGDSPYWLVLRNPVTLRFDLSVDVDSETPGSYPTILLLALIFIFCTSLLVVFAAVSSVQTAKKIRSIEDEEEKKRMLLVSEISHDLKTPLASVQGYSEMLLKKDVSEEVKKDYLQMIFDNSVRTNEILRSLFMYSKLESAGYRPNQERVDVCEFARLLIASYITRFEDAGFGYEFNIPEEEIFVDVDRELLRRVFENLIENSMKYNDPGTKIFIGIEQGKDIRITVSDDGCGIPEEHRERSWEPVYRADQNSKGSGLGLAIVKQIVEMHGGQIRLEPGKGCKWLITIPKPKN